MRNLNSCNIRSEFFKKSYFLIALIFFQCNSLYAQLRLVPIESSQYERPEAREGNILAKGDTLSLPFLDDFSTAKTSHPETTYWMSGSGVYINNTLTTNHPSINIATFDGVDASGVPYNFSNPLSRNYTDTLTSKPINLSGKAAVDSIYLSFYWAGKGLGERPDSADVIILEFLGNDNVWKEIKRRDGYDIVDGDSLFRQELVSINDIKYLFNAFQFRFRGYGRNSGPYDTWHLDYVYLNEKRSSGDKFIRDIAVRKPFTPFLKNYTAMPLRQYRVNPGASVAASVSTDIVNLNNEFNANSFIYSVTNKLFPTDSAFYLKNEGSIPIPRYSGTGPFSNQMKTYTPGGILFANSLTAITLQHKLVVLTTDAANPIANLNLNRNDTIYAYTDLSDYFAYDDGTAEYGVQINQKLGKVAVKYSLSKPDTIAGIRLSVVPFNKDIAGQSFTVQIYGNESGKPSDKPLAQRAVSARYATERNGFFEYAFETPVVVADTFYIGWTQLNEEPVTLGFDRNSVLSKGKIFYNLGTSWVPETSLIGNVMIRPYLSTGKGIITGTEPLPVAESYFYPNPSSGQVSWKSDVLHKINIYDVKGDLKKTIFPDKGEKSAFLNVPTDGIYIIKAWDGKRSISQKMLIVK